MDTANYIRLLDQQRKEQDFIYHAVAGKFGLSDTAMWVLYNVYAAKDAITQQELCRQGFFAKQTVNTAIAALCKSGCAVLEAIPGTRNHKKILLTEKGEALAKATIAPLMQAEERAYAALSPDELEAYLAMTVKLTVSLREETEKLQGGNL